MSTEKSKQRRKRLNFTLEFKAEAVRLVLEEGKKVGEVARDLALTAPGLRMCSKGNCWDNAVAVRFLRHAQAGAGLHAHLRHA